MDKRNRRNRFFSSFQRSHRPVSLLVPEKTLLTLTFVGALCCSAARADEPALLPYELLQEGWIQLFDGHSLFGWQPVGEAKWEVREGEIRTNGESPGFLMTTTEWADFELHVEFLAEEVTNSGVFLRSALEPTDPGRDCYELNIAPPHNPFPTGSLVKRQRVAATADRLPLPGTWHSFKVTAWRGWIFVELDGRRVADFVDLAPVRIGHIGLQSNSGPVRWRNIRLRPIELWPILTSNDLSSFNTQRAEKCRFEVSRNDGAYTLRVTNGPGQIETNQEYANFVLQLECKVNGDGLNSGIFFRTLRTGRWVGYESQINNAYLNGDRTKPADFGTGGIYRRQPARRIVANDHQWFTKTIVADGPHIAVWVNGYQVSDWTDERPPHDSPRQGKRLGPGAIAIQGHDPTTDFFFRNLRIAQLSR